MTIDLDQVLYADRYELRQRISLGRKWSLRYALHQLLFAAFRFPVIRRQARFIFFRSLVRDDYKTLFRSVVSVVKEEERVVVEDYLFNSKKISPKGVLYIFMLLPKLFEFKADSPFERLYLYFRLCFYYRQISALSKFKFENIVFFADMQPVENLASQYFRAKGKTTITLQHGLYVEYKNYPTVNVINYLHQPSEYFLSWGEETKSLIEKYHATRKVVVCGKPISPHEVAVTNAGLDSLRYITIIMDQNIFDHYNKEVLSIVFGFAKKNGYTINVKFHPYNKVKQYESLGIPFRSDLDIKNSCFVVGHTSSLMYELLSLGVPVFKYGSDVPCIDVPKELIFRSAMELEALVSSKYQFYMLRQHYVRYWGGESRDKYTGFFNSLRRNEPSGSSSHAEKS